MEEQRSKEGDEEGALEELHQGGMQINDLPAELLGYIFKFLVPVLKTKRDDEGQPNNNKDTNSKQKRHKRRKKAQRLNRSTSLSFISPSMSSLLALPTQKKAQERKKEDAWWPEWRKLRLVCKGWHAIVSDPAITMHLERRQHVFLAKVAEQAERYWEMVESMRSVARLRVEMTIEERNLLASAYKNHISSRLDSWKTVSTIESLERKKLSSDRNEIYLRQTQRYRELVEKELSDICRGLISLLDEYVLPHTKSQESKVFFYKMKGDYFRHLTDFGSEEEKKEAANNSLRAYNQANDISMAELPPAHPIRLGLALNFSVFHYEVLKQPEIACNLAKEAFADAIAELDTLDDASRKDSTLIMQLIRESLTLSSNGSLSRQGKKGDG